MCSQIKLSQIKSIISIERLFLILMFFMFSFQVSSYSSELLKDNSFRSIEYPYILKPLIRHIDGHIQLNYILPNLYPNNTNVIMSNIYGKDSYIGELSIISVDMDNINSESTQTYSFPFVWFSMQKQIALDDLLKYEDYMSYDYYVDKSGYEYIIHSVFNMMSELAGLNLLPNYCDAFLSRIIKEYSYGDECSQILPSGFWGDLPKGLKFQKYLYYNRLSGFAVSVGAQFLLQPPYNPYDIRNVHVVSVNGKTVKLIGEDAAKFNIWTASTTVEFPEKAQFHCDGHTIMSNPKINMDNLRILTDGELASVENYSEDELVIKTITVKANTGNKGRMAVVKYVDDKMETKTFDFKGNEDILSASITKNPVNGNHYLIFMKADKDGKHLFLAMADNNDENWTQFVQISRGAVDDIQPFILSDNGKVYIAFVRNQGKPDGKLIYGSIDAKDLESYIEEKSKNNK